MTPRIVVEPHPRGGWRVVAPGQPSAGRFARQSEAEVQARYYARRAKTGVVVRDAYHRVVGPRG